MHKKRNHLRLVVAVSPIALVLAMALGGLPRVAQATTASQPEDSLLAEPLVEDSGSDEDLELEEDGEVEVEPQSADAIASGVSGTCEWEVDAEGKLTIVPSNGIEGYLCDPVESGGGWSGCTASITSVEVQGNVKAEGSWKMAFACPNLEQADLSGLDTSAVTDMSYMFMGCQTLESLDLSTLDTGRVTTMYDMFGWCTNLRELDISGFDTHNVIYMSGMFIKCEKLSSLNLSNFDTQNVTFMEEMFSQCMS